MMCSLRNYLVLLALIASHTICLSEALNVEWSCIYGEPDCIEAGRGAYSSPDGNYIAGGNTKREGKMDCLVVLFDLDGDTISSRATGSYDNNETIANFYPLPDGRYISVGIADRESVTQAHLMIMNADGSHYLSGFYDLGFNQNYGLDVCPHQDSGYVICGSVMDNTNGNDAFLLGMHRIGDTPWSEVYSMNDWQVLFSVVPRYGEGYLAVGYSHNSDTERDEGMVYVTNQNGVPQVINFKGSDGSVVYKDVEILADSTFIVVGSISYSPDGARDLLIAKYDIYYQLDWIKTYGWDGDDAGECIKPTADGGFIIGGTCENNSMDYWALRINSDGDTLWTQICGTPRHDYLESIAVTEDDGFIICGTTQEIDIPYYYDMYVVKLEPEQVSIENESRLPQATALLQNYPNPFNANTTIKLTLGKTQNIALRLYDILGREIETLASGVYHTGNHQVIFNGSGLASGTYYYKLQTEDLTEINKMLLIK